MDNKIILPNYPLEKLMKLKNKFFSLICFASRKSGKSELIKFIYEMLDLGHEYDHVAVFSNSDESLDFYSEFVHGELFIKNFDEARIQSIINESEHLESDGRKKKFLVIFDDVIGGNIKYSVKVAELYAIGRHYGISCIWITQQVTLLNTTVRNNSDIILIGASKGAREKQSIVDNFLDGLADDTDMEKYGFTSAKKFYYSLLRYNTAEYHFIVIDYLSNRSNSFDDLVFRIKANLNIAKKNGEIQRGQGGASDDNKDRP